MVQSEADVIEYFVRCNILHVDYMIILVNPSEDGTLDILNKLAREGFPIVIWKTGINLYAQSTILTAIYKRIADQLDPDYIIFIDADEILLVDPETSLRASLATVPSAHLGLMRWVTFVPPSRSRLAVRMPGTRQRDRMAAIDPRRWTNRLAREAQSFSKIAIPRSASAERTIRIPNGFHSALDDDNQPIPSVELLGVSLAHMPIRSALQARQKALSGLINKGIAEGIAWHGTESWQRENVIDYFEKKGASADNLTVAKKYLCDDWNDVFDTDVVKDCRLPKLTLRYGDSVSNLLPEIALGRRVMASLFPQPDPTKTLKNLVVRAASDQTSPTGVFDPLFHASNLCCDWPPFGMMRDRFEPRSVLDVGCGLGAYLRIFRNSGAEVFGVDGADYSSHHFIDQDEYAALDMDHCPLLLDRSFDVTLCVEVLEHLEEAPALSLVDAMAAQTKRAILFSAAQLDQPGYAHKTLREPEFWLRRFEDAGWAVDVPGSMAARVLSTLHWFRRNLFVLLPKSQACSENRHKLLQMGKHFDRNGGSYWRAHRPGETVVGFPGQAWAMTMDCGEELPPLANYSPAEN
jgi:SAM-dependent methyltransferase